MEHVIRLPDFCAFWVPQSGMNDYTLPSSTKVQVFCE
jgi:hypothetical protein